jgi:UDP-N-acetylmuramoyl-tripeptide--D-alanyl-D-alanine ligase
LLGRQNVANALAAAAAAEAAGASAQDVVTGLARVEPVRGRLKALPGRAGATIVDDSYNANPGSVRAALDFLGGQKGLRIMAFGDMGELGANAVELHREIGRYARGRCDRFVAVGTLAAEAAAAFGADAHAVADVDAARAVIEPALAPEVTVLVKASRSARLERLVQALTEASSC